MNNRPSLGMIKGRRSIQKAHEETQRHKNSDELKAETPADFSVKINQKERWGTASIFRVSTSVDFEIKRQRIAQFIWRCAFPFPLYLSIPAKQLTRRLPSISRRTELSQRLRQPSLSSPQIVVVVWSNGRSLPLPSRAPRTLQTRQQYLKKDCGEKSHYFLSVWQWLEKVSISSIIKLQEVARRAGNGEPTIRIYFVIKFHRAILSNDRKIDSSLFSRTMELSDH